MSIRTSLITAIATLALAAPVVANAAAVKAPAPHGGKPTVSLKGHPRKGSGPLKIVPRKYPVTYIHVTTTYPSGLVEVDQCQLSGYECTAQEACILWSVGCDDLSNSVQADSTPATAPSSPPPSADGSTGDPGPTELADVVAGSSTPDSSSIDSSNDC